MANTGWQGGASSVPNDYSDTNNWSNGVPGAGDNAEIGPRTTMYAIDGYNASGTAIGNFYVLPGYTKAIGDQDTYLQVDPDDFEFAGTGKAFIDIGSANISPRINDTVAATNGQHGLYLKGSNIATLTVNKGNVGIGALSFETATVATLRVGYVTNKDSDSKVTVGDGVTLTTLLQEGGTNTLQCAATTVTVNGGSLTIDTSGNITTLNINNGTVYGDRFGTITTVNLNGPSAKLVLNRSVVARTITTLNPDDGQIIYNPNVVTITNFNEPTDAATVTVRPL